MGLWLEKMSVALMVLKMGIRSVDWKVDKKVALTVDETVGEKVDEWDVS